MRSFINKAVFVLIFIFIFPHFSETKTTKFVVKAYLEEDKIFVNKEARLTIVVRTDKDVLNPRFPAVPNLDINFVGASVASPTFVGGAVTWERYYLFSIIAKRKGVFEIPSAMVKVGGEQMKTDSFTVEALESGDEETQDGEPVFVTSEVSSDEAFINEEIIYTLKFYRRVNVENETLDSPVFEGFIVETIEPEIDYKETIGEIDYYVHEKKLALFPLKTGKLIIPPSKIICDVPVQDKSFGAGSDIPPYDTSGRLVSKTFASSVVSVKIKKLPDEVKPANFKNLVGDYSIKAELSKSEINMGETTSLIVTVSGKGNINDIAEPDIPEIKEFKVYNEFPVVKLFKDGNAFAGEKIFKKILFPLNPGKKIIPSVGIVFFHPSKGKYIKSQSQVIHLNIIKSADNADSGSITEKKVVFKQSVRQVAEDILPVKLSLKSLKNSQTLPELNFIIGLFLLPPLVFLLFLFLSLKKRKGDEETDKYRKTNAIKIFSGDMKKIDVPSGSNDRELSEMILNNVKIYFGNKLGVSGESLTVRDIKKILNEKKINKENEEEFILALEKTEFMAFGNQNISQNDIEKIAHRMATLIKTIDKLI